VRGPRPDKKQLRIGDRPTDETTTPRPPWSGPTAHMSTSEWSVRRPRRAGG